MDFNLNKKMPVNRYLVIIVFVLLILACMQFIYLCLRSLSIAPNYTGTVSDIIIATTNIILATYAVRAFKNLFKDKLSDNAISKIDTALMSLDDCIDSFSSLFLNMTLIKIYKNTNNPKDPQLVKQLDEAAKNIEKATSSAYKARSIIGSLTRWNISLNTEKGIRLNQLTADVFELGMQVTNMYIALINEINPNSPYNSLTHRPFDELFNEFNKEKTRVEDESNELKEFSIHEIFKIK
ncbi:hypothetical protein CQS32_RS19635 [Escherichia coli]|nr:hypothetical protein [Escherichia coli]